MEDPLFKKLWETPNVTRQEEFVSFLGRHYLTRDNAGDEWLKENGVNKQKLIDFWTWLLRQDNVPTAVFSGFGFWINPHKPILDLSWSAPRIAETMKKAEGQFDWEYGLMEQLPSIAEISPKDALEIIRSYLLTGDNLNPHRRGWIHVDRELRATLEVLYSKKGMKQDVYDLINMLIVAGGSQFWSLKSVLKK